MLNQQINQRVVFKLNLSLSGKEIKFYIYIVAYNPYRVNCVVDKEGMAAVPMMDFPLQHVQAASANQRQDGSPGSGEKRPHLPRVAVGCLCLPLAWLPALQRGKEVLEQGQMLARCELASIGGLPTVLLAAGGWAPCGGRGCCWGQGRGFGGTAAGQRVLRWWPA